MSQMHNQSNRELFDKMMQFRQNLRKVDWTLDSEKSISTAALRSWYFQHLLMMTIEQFAKGDEIIVPQFMSRFQYCFSDDPGMTKVWRHLLNVKHADKLILKPAFDDLKNALATQMLPVQITDELTQWRVSVRENGKQ